MSSSTPLALLNGSYLSSRPTGIGVVARELGNALDPKLVRLLDPLGGDRQGSVPIPKNLSPDDGRKGHLRRLIWTQRCLPNLLRTSGAQLLLSPLPESPLFKGVRSVVIAHDLLPLRQPQLSPLLAYHLAYVPLVLHRAVKVLCNSDATAREVHARLGVPIRKLVTIPLGFNASQLSPMNIKREPFFLVLGRHDPHKNLSLVLRAIALLPDKEFKLIFAGPHDRRYTPKLIKLADELGVAKRCTWIPWVSDYKKNYLLNTCQALVIPSLWEGFGLPALEAMACNTPVLSSMAGALPEVISDAGILFNPKDYKALADAMQQITIDGLLRGDLVQKGRLRLMAYSWERSARLVEKILTSLQR